MPATLPLSARDQMISSLFAPPQPTTYAPAGGGDPTAMAALGASGFLGETGRFMAQLARAQEARKLEQDARLAAEEIGQIYPLDPNYVQRVSEVQGRFPLVFGTQPVQSALRLGMNARGETMQQQQDQLELERQQQKLLGKQAIRKAGPEQLGQFEEQMPPSLVAELGPDLEKRAAAIGEAEALIQQLPTSARTGVDANNPVAVKNAVSKFQSSLPSVFSKIKGNPDEIANAVEYASRIKAFKAKEAEHKKKTGEEYIPTEEEFQEIQGLTENLEATLGAKAVNVDTVLKAQPLLGGSDWRPDFLRERQEKILKGISMPLTPGPTVGQ